MLKVHRVLKKDSPFAAVQKEGFYIMEIQKRENTQESRIAVVNILVWDRAKSEKINALLSSYGDFVVGRMGIPYREKGVFVLCVVLDAPVEIVNALTGKLGKTEGVTVKALFGKI